MKQPAPKKHRAPKRFAVSHKDREYFTSNLALLIKANVAVGEAFEALKETTKSRGLKNALTQMQNDIDEGLPLWQTLQRSHIVSPQTMTLIQLGEQSGNLVENLRIAAVQEEKQRIFRAKVRSALIYPVFVISLTVIVGLGVAWFLLPRLADTFSQLRVDLPLVSQVMINFGQFLQDNGIWAVPAALAVVAFALYIIFAAPHTKAIGQWLLFHMPGIAKLLHEIETARFGYLFGTLLKAGLSVTESLRLMTQATTARQYQRFYANLGKAFDEGWSFAESTAKMPKSEQPLPPSVRQMIIAGERSGSLPETLQNIGSIYEEKANISTQNLQSILEPILLVVVWLGVMGVAVAIIMPIYSLVGGLGV
jgi:type IV pilus assembly protein PilC